MNDISAIIRQRRAIFPASFTDKIIPDEWIWELLENANHAPTHRLTQPWRFRVVAGAAREQLGQLLAEAYRNITPKEQFSELKYQKTIKNTLRASHIIAIGQHRAEKESLPEWEELAAVAMAVQNIWLSASAMGVGGYWSSPETAQESNVRAFLNWGAQEKALGFFYLGFHEVAPIAAVRGDIREKVQWLR